MSTLIARTRVVKGFVCSPIASVGGHDRYGTESEKSISSTRRVIVYGCDRCKKKPIKKYCEDHIARRRSRTFKTCGEFVSRAQIVVGKKRCRETEEFSEACEKYAFCREELTVKRAAVYPNTFGSETPRFTTTALQPGGVFVAYTRSKGRRIRY